MISWLLDTGPLVAFFDRSGMSELKRACRIFTVDKADFQIYRRFERQAIPLIAPD